MPQPLLIIFSDLGLGGIQKKIVDIVNVLHVTHPNVPVYIILRSQRDFTITHTMHNPQVKVLDYKKIVPLRLPFFFTGFILYCAWHLNPQVVLSFLSPFALPAMLAKLLFVHRSIRVVINEDHYTSAMLPKFRYALLNALGIRLMYPLSNGVISPTRATQNDLIEQFGIPANKVTVIPNWTNLADRKISKTKKRFDLVYIGRFVQLKRVDRIVRLVSMLKKRKPDIRACLVGDGEEKDKLKTLAQELKVQNNIFFTGPTETTKSYISQSRVFVCTSERKGEGFPLAILESMAVGTPVLTFRFAGVTEVVRKNQTGFLVSSLHECREKVFGILNGRYNVKPIVLTAKKIVKKNYSIKTAHRYIDALLLKP